MNKGKLWDRKGFTLAELLIVVAILGILVAIAIPIFGDARDRASAAQCLANRTMIEHAYKSEVLFHNDLNSPEALRNFVNKMIADAKAGTSEYFSGVCSCGEGGRYSYRLGNVVCTNIKHGGKAGSSGLEEAMEDSMVQTIEEIFEDKGKLSKDDFFNKYGFSIANVRNDTLRDYLFKIYGGWPQFSQEFLDKNGLEGNYYIQPFIAEGNIAGEVKSIVIFGHSTNNTTAGAWFTDMYFSFENDAWYKRQSPISFNSTYGNIAAIEKDILENPGLWSEMKN